MVNFRSPNGYASAHFIARRRGQHDREMWLAQDIGVGNYHKLYRYRKLTKNSVTSCAGGRHMPRPLQVDL